MRIISFSDAKRPILTFKAEETELTPDGEAYLIQASGIVTFQDNAVLEEILHGARSCLIHVEENSETLLEGRFETTFLVLEEEQLVVRLVIG